LAVNAGQRAALTEEFGSEGILFSKSVAVALRMMQFFGEVYVV
jgi:hypothetical protein